MGRRSQGNRVHVCRVCGIEFRRWTDAATYCSRVCMTIDYRVRNAGPGNPAWRGGQWKYRGRRWVDIAADCIARDGACADCGTVDGLIAHHLVPQRFWLDLDRANAADNLLTLCGSCHARRPEHYWRVVPDDAFDPALHSRVPVRRVSARLAPKPACEVCGAEVAERRRRFCSYACSNRARWRNGLFNADASLRNLGDPAVAARKAVEVRRDIARLGKATAHDPVQAVANLETGEADA